MKKTKKVLKLFKLSMLPVFLLPTVAISCTDGVKKDYQQWGASSFVKEYKKLSYKKDAEEAKLINEIDYTKPRSNSTYQMMVYAFADGNNDGIGDFIGAKDKLSYIRDLGFDQIWLSPLHPASSYHGYDVIDYTDVAPEFGGMKAFDAFLKEAHKQGIKIYLDMVFNHTSYEHPWFQKAIEDKNSKYRNFYRFNDNNNDYGDTNTLDSNLASKFVNLKNPQIPKTNYVSKFWAGMPDLNLDNPEVIEELENVQNFWIKKGVDGFRYDAFMEFFSSKGETQKNYNIQKIFADFRESMNKVTTSRSDKFDPYLFGEWWGSALEARNYFYDGKRRALDSGYDAGHWKNNAFVTMGYDSMYDITSKYSENSNANEQWMPFLDNHDETRWVNAYIKDIMSTNISTAPKTLPKRAVNAVSTALFSLLTRPNNPIVFQGDELAFHGRKSPNDAALREPMNWSNKKYVVDFYEKRSGENERIKLSFSSDRPSPKSQIDDPTQPAYLVKTVNEWRRNNPSLASTDSITIEKADKYYQKISGKPSNIFIRKSSDGNKKFLVGFTMEGSAKIKVNNGIKRMVVSSYQNKVTKNDIEMGPNSYFIAELV